MSFSTAQSSLRHISFMGFCIAIFMTIPLLASGDHVGLRYSSVGSLSLLTSFLISEATGIFICSFIHQEPDKALQKSAWARWVAVFGLIFALVFILIGFICILVTCLVLVQLYAQVTGEVKISLISETVLVSSVVFALGSIILFAFVSLASSCTWFFSS